MVYALVRVGKISQSKLERAVKTGKLALTAKEVAGDTHTLHLHPAALKAFRRAKSTKKGIRLAHSHHEIKADLKYHGASGGSLWSWIKTKAAPWLKKHWGDIKPFVSLALDAGAKFYPEALPARAAVKSLTGVGLKRGRLVKGSKAARDHMATLRAMRHTGGSFRL
jgi:hypothetical protein